MLTKIIVVIWWSQGHNEFNIFEGLYKLLLIQYERSELNILVKWSGQPMIVKIIDIQKYSGRKQIYLLVMCVPADDLFIW